MRITTLTKIIIFCFLLWNAPIFAATLTVNSTADTAVSGDGQCTLREAISNANANTDSSGGDCAAGEIVPVIDVIVFNIQKPATVTLYTQLRLTDAVEIVNTPSPNDLTIRRADDAPAFVVFYVITGVFVKLEGLTITNGFSDYDGGGIYVASYGMLTVVNCSISGNTATTKGSAINSRTSSVVTIENSTFEGNVINSILEGGTIYNSEGTLRVVNSTIANNVGTGIYYRENQLIQVTNTTISGNIGGLGGGIGGDIFNSPITLEITNSTIIGNESLGYSGMSFGGGLFTGSGIVKLYNSIIAGNIASENPDISATLTNSSNNIIGDPEGCDGCENSNNILNITDLSQILDLNLALNGAPTGSPKTHALILSPDNPAIDGGDDTQVQTTTDQRGEFRTINNTVDIGASEYTAPIDYNFAQAAYTTQEDDSFHTFNEIKIIRANDSNIPVQITLSNRQIIEFTQGQLEQSVPIEILGNTLVEPNQTIDLSLVIVYPNGEIGTQATTTLTIRDDDDDDMPAPLPPEEKPYFYSEPTPDSTINFGNTLLNASSEQNLLIKSTGEKTLRIELKSLTSTDFTLVSSDFPLRIPANDDETVVLRCTPTAIGMHTATLTFKTNDSSKPTVNYTLICTGIAPVYTSDPKSETPLDFGSVKIGESVSYELTVSEIGDAELRLETITIDNSEEFTHPIKTPISIPDGGKSQTITLQCTPTVAGERTALLTIKTNDPNRPQIIYPLICNGLLDITTLTVEVTEGGRITSNPAGITCPKKCQAQFTPNTEITLSANPNPGWQFVEWTGDCDETGHVFLDAEKHCNALFSPIFHTLTLKIEGEGQITSIPEGIQCPEHCENTFLYNTNLEFTVQPRDGYQAEWSEGCSENLTLTEDKTCTVYFKEIPVILPPKEYTLTINIEGEGHVAECADTCVYPADTALTLTPEPADGYQFDRWTGNCDAQGNVTLTANQSCTAVFNLLPPVEEKYTVTVNVAPGGYVTVMPEQENYEQTFSKTYPADTQLYFKAVDYLENITEPTFVARPNANQQFNGWGGDCAGRESITINKDLNCTVTFGTANLTIEAVGAGKICVKGTSDCYQKKIFSYQAGGQLTLEATTNSQFLGWTGCQQTTDSTIVVSTDKSQFCIAQFTADADGDGVPDAQEKIAPNGGDGNGDGIPDNTQNNVASLSLPFMSDRYVTLETSPSCPVTNAKLEGGIFSNNATSYFPPTVIFNTTCQKPAVSIYYHGMSNCGSYENRSLFEVSCANKIVGGKTVAVISANITNENGTIRFGDLSFDTVVITLSEDPEKFKCAENCTKFNDSGEVLISVKRRGFALKGQVQADYETLDGTAISGRDYETAHGTLSWEGDEINETITINLINNTVYDGKGKTFTIRLSNLRGDNAKFLVDQQTFTILDDDCAPNVIKSGIIDANCVVEGREEPLENLTEVQLESALNNVVIFNDSSEEKTFVNQGTITDSVIQGKIINQGIIYGSTSSGSTSSPAVKMVVGQITNGSTSSPTTALSIKNQGYIMYATVGQLTTMPKDKSILVEVENSNIIKFVTFGHVTFDVTNVQIKYPFVKIINKSSGIIADSKFEYVLVENEGIIRNATISEYAEIKGGILQGHIINNGILEDITLETPVGSAKPSVIEGIEGGELRGYIVNGGILRNVHLGNKVTGERTLVRGGILEVKITGEPEKPARLEELTISAGTSLEGVWIGNNITLEENVTFDVSVRFVGNTEPPCHSDGKNHKIGKGYFHKEIPNYLTCKLITRHEQAEVPVTRRPNGMLELPCEEAYFVSISATLNIPPEQPANIFIMATHRFAGETTSYARDGENWIPIKPAILEQLPIAIEKYQGIIPIYEGYLAKDLKGKVGKLEITVGYRLADGTITYNDNPIQIGFTCPVTSK